LRIVETREVREGHLVGEDSMAGDIEKAGREMPWASPKA